MIATAFSNRRYSHRLWGLWRVLVFVLLLLSPSHVAAEDAPATKPFPADGVRLLINGKKSVKIIAPELSEDAADVLAEYEGGIRLVLETLSVGVAERLAQHKGDMCIDVTRDVAKAAVEAFKDHRGFASIDTPFSQYCFANREADPPAQSTRPASRDTSSPKQSVATAVTGEAAAVAVKPHPSTPPSALLPAQAAPKRPNPLTWERLLQMTGPEGPGTRYIRNADGSLRRVEARHRGDLLVAVTEVEGGFRVTLGNELALADFASRPWFTASERDALIDAYSEFVTGTVRIGRLQTAGRFDVIFGEDPEFRIKTSVTLTPAD